MKITKVLTGILMLVSFISCRTMKETHSEKSKLDSTAESSKEIAKAITIDQHNKSIRLDTSYKNSQTGYERQTLKIEYPALDSNGKVLGNVTYTLINEKGNQYQQSGKTTRKKTDWKQKKKGSIKSTGKKSSAVSIVETAKNKNKTTTGGWPLTLMSIIAIVLAIISIIIIVRRKIKTLLCITIVLLAFSCGQKVETPPVVPVEIKQPQPVRLTLLEIARKEIGKKEKPIGSNWGPDVQKYLNSVDLKSSNPWCMAYIYWVVDQYCNQYKYQNPLFKTGHVATQWRQCKPLRVANPQPEDIFIMIFKNGTGHCGFVDSVSIDGKRIYTIEGNTNTDGSRNGYMVCRQTNGRLTKEITGFIRPVFKK